MTSRNFSGEPMSGYYVDFSGHTLAMENLWYAIIIGERRCRDSGSNEKGVLMSRTPLTKKIYIEFYCDTKMLQ